MQKITSFTVDHTKLEPGIYVSRVDCVAPVDGNITTYDLRTRKPNAGDYMTNVAMHTVEHMFATFVRNSDMGKNVIYFGPMGCRTGFYLVMADSCGDRDEENRRILALVKDVLGKIIAYDGPVFGQSEVECGNYRELDLEAGREECRRYLAVLESREWDFRYNS